MLKINLTCLVILYYFSLYFVIFIYTLLFLVILSVSEIYPKILYIVILSVSRSIHKFKVRIAPLRRGFFTLNLKCVLKLWIFRFVLTHFAQNDKRCRYFANAQYGNMDFFAAAMPCNPLGRLFAKAQNDNFS